MVFISGTELYNLIDDKEEINPCISFNGNFISIGKDNFNSKDILEYLNENPKVREINAGFIRNEGLLISLRNDRIVKIEK